MIGVGRLHEASGNVAIRCLCSVGMQPTVFVIQSAALNMLRVQHWSRVLSETVVTSILYQFLLHALMRYADLIELLSNTLISQC